MTWPKLIAHRGYAHRYPENTLAALQAAIDVGAHHVEFDVQLTANRVPVVLHDVELKRATGVGGSVHESTDQALKALSAHEPQRLGDQFKGVGIPSLHEACELIAASPGVTGFVELKQESVDFFGQHESVRATMDVVSRFPDFHRFVLISDHLDALVLARESGWPSVGWILDRWDEPSRRAAQDNGPQYLFANVRKVPDSPTPFWPGPWRWAVYEIADAQAALAWHQRGADFIETFRVGELMADPRWGQEGGADASV